MTMASANNGGDRPLLGNVQNEQKNPPEGGSNPQELSSSSQEQIQQQQGTEAEESPVTGPTPPAPSPSSSSAQNVTAVSGLHMAQNSYDELSVIGRGAYGDVYLGRDKSRDGRLVALKKIKITLSEDGVPVNALREIALLKQLEKYEHPNIVRLLDICHGRLERENRLTLILVFEYVDMDMDNYLKKCPSPGLDLGTIKSLMYQVLSGVDFLHRNRIIHRDLKPQNLLVDKYQRVKIADFGLARIYDFHMKLTTMVVTVYYRAPEVLLSNSYATPVDMWSCGCIFAELYRKKPLFMGQTEGDQLQRIFDVIGKPSESEWPKDISLSLSNFREHIGRPFEDVVPEITPDAVDLLRNLLKFVPGTRICANDAMKHPFFRGVCLPSTSNKGMPPSNPTTTSSQGVASTSLLSQKHISTITNTISSTTISASPSNLLPAATSDNSNTLATSQTIESGSDENNPNAGNSSNISPMNVSSSVAPNNNNTISSEQQNLELPKVSSAESPVNNSDRVLTKHS